MRNKSPIDVVKDKVTDFQEASLDVEFFLEAKYDQGGSGQERDIKSFPERKEVLTEIISKVNAELDKDDGYKNFKSELSDFRKKAESLSVRLTKYVEECVSIVNI